MKTYYLNLRDDSGSSHIVEIDAESPDQATAVAHDTVQDEAEDWCSDGDWGDDGAEVVVWWDLTDDDGDDLADGRVTVTIEPDHAALIADAVGSEGCGDSPDDHDWTSEGEGGCEENPGVWSTGGTSLTIRSHCRCCGLQRTEHLLGSQRNPGECDTVTYAMPEESA